MVVLNVQDRAVDRIFDAMIEDWIASLSLTAVAVAVIATSSSDWRIYPQFVVMMTVMLSVLLCGFSVEAFHFLAVPFVYLVFLFLILLREELELSLSA